MPDPEHQERAVEKVKDLLGTPYKTGGSDSEGTDCSGLTNQAYPDYFPKRETAAGQLEYLKKKGDEDVPAKDLKPGDLVYFKDKNVNITHTAIVEKVDASADHPVSIIAASSNPKKHMVVRQKLRKNGKLGDGLMYAGGGRPR